jgi:hypothetical protein
MGKAFLFIKGVEKIALHQQRLKVDYRLGHRVGSVVVKAWRKPHRSDHRCGQVARRSQTLRVASAGY